MGDALIRAVLHTDPEDLADEFWSTQVIMAENIQNMYVRKLARIISG